MPAETLWTVVDPVLEAPDLANADGVQPDGVVMRSTSKVAALAYANRRNQAMNRCAPERRCQVVEYVRKDVADAEVARLRAAIRTYLASEYYDDYRERLRSPEFEVDQPAADLLAACSEGDNDERK